MGLVLMPIYYAINLLSLQLTMLSILYLPGLSGFGSDANLLCYQLTKSTTYNAINFVSSWVEWVWF